MVTTKDRCSMVISIRAVAPIWVSAAGQRVGNLDKLVTTTIDDAGNQALNDAHDAVVYTVGATWYLDFGK